MTYVTQELNNLISLVASKAFEAGKMRILDMHSIQYELEQHTDDKEIVTHCIDVLTTLQHISNEVF